MFYSSDVLKLASVEIPLILFYDETFVYTNNKAEIDNSLVVKRPRFFGITQKWVKYKHNDTLKLPNGQNQPLGILSFAASIRHGSNEMFFIMGTPSFWIQNEVMSDDLGDGNLYTSILIHEFAHTQQTKNFGKKLQEFENNIRPDIELSDNLIQHVMEKNLRYSK